MRTSSTLTADPISPAPIPAQVRLASLDVLRGFAILGVLPLLIQAHAEPWTASLNPATGGYLSGANGIIWIIAHILFSVKFLTILSVSFGAGIVLLAARTDGALPKNKVEYFPTSRTLLTGAGGAALHTRRMAGLLAIGLVLALFSPIGEVLALFAVCGALIFPLRLWPAPRLAFAGALNLAFGAFCLLGAGALLNIFDTTQINQKFPAFGEFTSNARVNLLLLLSFLSRTLGLMLAGMALLKSGALSAAWPASRYVMIITCGVFIGYPLVIFGILENVSHGWDMAYAVGIGAQYNYWGALIIAGGYTGFVMLICKHHAWERLQNIMTAIGRAPLSNLTIQILVSAWIFSSHGTTHATPVDRLEQLIIAGIIALAQIIISPVWLRYFRYGPAEWAWRWITTARRPPFIYMNRVFAPYIRPGAMDGTRPKRR